MWVGVTRLAWLVVGVVVGQMLMWNISAPTRCSENKASNLAIFVRQPIPTNISTVGSAEPTTKSFSEIIDQFVDLSAFHDSMNRYMADYEQMLDEYCFILSHYAEHPITEVVQRIPTRTRPPALHLDCKNPEFSWVLTGKQRLKPVRIFDLFLINTELDILEIRLNELAGVVDKFVMLESTHNHRYASKPLFFGRNKHLFRGFWNQTLHLIFDESDIIHARRTTTKPANRAQDFTLEILNRRALMNKFRHAIPKEEGDLLLLSDVDEILDRNLLYHIKHCEVKDLPIRFRTEFFLFHFNLTRQKTWQYPNLGLDEHYIRAPEGIVDPTWFRFERQAPLQSPLINGWHLNRFSFPEFRILKELSMSETTKIPVHLLRNPSLVAKEVSNYPASDIISSVARSSSPNLPWFVAANPHKFPHFFAEWWQVKANE